MFLVVSCVLGIWTIYELDTLYQDTVEMSAFDDVYHDTHLILNPDEIDDDNFDLRILERSISYNIMMLATSLDPDQVDQERLRNDLWQRLQFDDHKRFEEAASQRRLETLFTTEMIAELYPLLWEMRDHLRTRNGKRFGRYINLKAYLKELAALFTISLGTAIISYQEVRRKSALA